MRSMSAGNVSRENGSKPAARAGEFVWMGVVSLVLATFNTVRTDLLPIAALAIAGASVLAWRLRDRYDVLALGRDVAVNLGVDYRRTVMLTLVLIAIMVSVSTALVGPVTSSACWSATSLMR